MFDFDILDTIVITSTTIPVIDSIPSNIIDSLLGPSEITITWNTFIEDWEYFSQKPEEKIDWQKEGF